VGRLVAANECGSAGPGLAITAAFAAGRASASTPAVSNRTSCNRPSATSGGLLHPERSSYVARRRPAAPCGHRGSLGPGASSVPAPARGQVWSPSRGESRISSTGERVDGTQR
jgi:hypothetical protein